MSDNLPFLNSEKDNFSIYGPLNDPSFAARLGDRVSERIRRWRLRRQGRAPELTINVELMKSRPEMTGEDRNIQRPWTREIIRLLGRLPDSQFELFMIHRAHGYHGMPFPENSNRDYRRAHEIGRLERDWENSQEGQQVPTEAVTGQINVHLQRIADYFNTKVDEQGNFQAISSDQTSSFKEW